MRPVLSCLALFLAAAPTLFGQAVDLDSDTVTVTAARYSMLPPDQASVAVHVSVDVATPLDAVVALLAGTGISAADLTQAGPYAPFGGGGGTAQWIFTHSVPLANLSALLSSLEHAQSQAKSSNTVLGFLYYVQGVQRSAATAPQCAVPTLISDARAMAQSLAAAAGLTLGVVVSFWQPALTPPAGPQVGQPTYGAAVNMILTSPRPAGLAYTDCALTVQFKFLH